MKELLVNSINVAKEIQGITLPVPPTHNAKPSSEQVLAFSLVKGTRQYIEQITHQINGCYENGYYDGCGVMIRRLVETLIIECYEYHKLEHKIKTSGGDYPYLADLINSIVSESAWSLGRNAKKSLPNMKDIGDKSAHSRRFIAHRSDIDRIKSDLRVVVQELVLLSSLQK